MKKPINIKKLTVVIAITGLVVQLLFCSTQYAGGSEIGNPLVVCGTVTDSLGKGVLGVNLFLVDPLENDPSKLRPDSCYQTVSSSGGAYRFTGVHQGIFNLFGRDTSGEKMFIKSVTLQIDKTVNENGDTLITLDSDTLKEAAKIIVAISTFPSASGDYLFIPGTVIRVPVDSLDEYLIKCPPSTVDIVLHRSNSQVVLVNDLKVSQGQWVDLTGKSFDVPKPEIISGVITGVTGRMYYFLASTISLGPNNPVQYRFDWGDSVSLWSLSSQGNHVWNATGSLQVRVQARSIRDTLSVSEWSDAVDVQIQ
jgi:hypothetical protein